MSVDEDDALRKPAVIITANLPKDFPQKVDILEPFFAGKLVILAKYKGSGLEFSNANLIARYLGLDYSAQVTGGKLVVKVIFTIIEKSL
jgi:hypothetical protein